MQAESASGQMQALCPRPRIGPGGVNSRLVRRSHWVDATLARSLFAGAQQLRVVRER